MPMAGKSRRDTSFVTATPSTVTSSSAAFGRWAFGIGQPGRDRRGRTGIVKGRSVRSAGKCLDHVVVFGERHLRHLLRSYTTSRLERGSHAPFSRQGSAVAAKFDNAFAVQTGQTVDHHKSGIRP